MYFVLFILGSLVIAAIIIKEFVKGVKSEKQIKAVMKIAEAERAKNPQNNKTAQKDPFDYPSWLSDMLDMSNPIGILNPRSPNYMGPCKHDELNNPNKPGYPYDKF